MRLELGYNLISQINGLEKLDKLVSIDLRGNPIYDSYIKDKNNLKKLVKHLNAQDLVNFCKQKI